jgi:hypothetical protein
VRRLDDNDRDCNGDDDDSNNDGDVDNIIGHCTRRALLQDDEPREEESEEYISECDGDILLSARPSAHDPAAFVVDDASGE